MKFRRINFQFNFFKSLFNRDAKARPVSEIPILYPNKISYSSRGTLESCTYRFWLQHQGNWWGWVDDAPPAVQQAYWTKRTVGWQGWAGNLIHNFVMDVLFNEIDKQISRQTGVIPKTDQQLLDLVKERFEGEWRQSLNWEWPKFKEIKRSDKPVWLRHHAWRHMPWGNNDSWNEVQDRRLKRKAWDWVERSVSMVISQYSSFHDNSDFKNWLIIEGLKLNKGLVGLSEDSQIKSQAQLRQEDIYPSFKLDVDGEVWEYQFAIDFMVFTSQGKYLIIDYKTGSDKRWESHREQLFRYAAFILQEPDQFRHLGLPRVKLNNLILRIVYTDPGVSQPIRDFRPLVFTTANRLLKKAYKDVRKLRQYLVPLGKLDDNQRQSLQRLLPHRLFAGTEGLYERDGKTLNRQTDSDSLVALPDDFQPVAAQEGKHWICNHCESLPLCRDGQELIAINNLKNKKEEHR